MDGGSGRNTASYANASVGVVVNLVDASGNTWDARGDQYLNIQI